MTPAIKRYSHFMQFNFFRRPDWRWERVRHLADQVPVPGRCSCRDDEYVKKARAFLLRWRARETEQQREELWWSEPGLYYAYDFHRRVVDEPDAAMIIQARLLSGQSPQEVAQALGTTAEAVAWYEALFFNVADRLGNRDWITKQVLLPAVMRHFDPADQDDTVGPFRSGVAALPFLDGTLKMFAYFGGPYIADVMIAGFQAGKPAVSPEHVNEWFDQRWFTTMRRRSNQAALRVPINKFNATELFHVHARIVEIERSAESQEQARSTHERTVQALLDAIPMSAGRDGRRLYAGTAVDRLDDGASEMRDTELQLAAAGGVVDDSGWPKALPAPRPKQAG